ncbi:MAG: ABC transporter permease [Firmicutes bacterium]|nr:ABC transporter permease [Bacillota bacterium]
MAGLFTVLQGAVAQGVLWGIMAVGIYITYKILNLSDLTVDGSFALGGCVCAVMIINFNMDPFLATIIAIVAGIIAGAVTGILHTMFDIPAILAGILTQISLWSINLRIMGGKSNIPLLNVETVISKFVGRSGNTILPDASPLAQTLGLTQSQASLIIGIIIVILVVLFMYWFFGTEIGCALRATGNNEDMIRALGVDIKITKLIAFMFANGLVALAGSLVCQSQKYADINMGTGAIVIGLAAIIIGEVFMKRFINFGLKLSSAVVGAVVYFIIRAGVLRLGMSANDMKLLSALIVAIALIVPIITKKIQEKRAYQEGDIEEC